MYWSQQALWSNPHFLASSSLCICPWGPWAALAEMKGGSGIPNHVAFRWISMVSCCFFFFLPEGNSEPLSLHLGSGFGFIPWWHLQVSVFLEPFDIVEALDRLAGWCYAQSLEIPEIPNLPLSSANQYGLLKIPALSDRVPVSQCRVQVGFQPVVWYSHGDGRARIQNHECRLCPELWTELPRVLSWCWDRDPSQGGQFNPGGAASFPSPVWKPLVVPTVFPFRTLIMWA